jgi:hypothetical protein
VANEDVVRYLLKTAAIGLEPFIAAVVAERLPDFGHWSTLLSEKDARVGFDTPAQGSGDVSPKLRMLTERLGPHGYFFSSQMPRVAATYASELIAVRNAWAHLREFDDADTYRAIDTTERLLRAVGAVEQARELIEVKQGLLSRLASAQDQAVGTDVELLNDVLATAPAADEAPPVAQMPVDSKSARIEAQDLTSEAADVEEGTREILAGMTRPLPLAAVSQQVIMRFGQESILVWGGSGGFTTFLQKVEPRAVVSGPQPGYVHPIGRAVPDGWDREPQESDVPPSFRILRFVDPMLPLVTWARMQDTISAVLDAGPVGGSSIAALSNGTTEGRTRAAVAMAGEQGRLIFKSDAVWVLKTLTKRQASEDAASLSSARQAVATEIASLATAADVDAAQMLADVRGWLSGPIDS